MGEYTFTFKKKNLTWYQFFFSQIMKILIRRGGGEGLPITPIKNLNISTFIQTPDFIMLTSINLHDVILGHLAESLR